MNKRMIGDVVVVVIDEIGEVTFLHDPMDPLNVSISKKETTERAFAAVIEMVDVCCMVVPTSSAHFALCQALELLLRDQKFLTERLCEQVEFNDSLTEAAGSLWQSEINSHKKRGQ